MEAAIYELDRRFNLPGIAEVVEGHGRMPKVRITSPNVAGEIYLHGAHVTSWIPAGREEVLFLSSQSRWEHGHAIRGGVPICFPWFAEKADDPSAPVHGFVRTAAWRLESITQSGDAITVSMVTKSSEDTKRWWPADFRLVYRATFGSELGLELVVENTGTKPLRFEEALHAYHRVGNIETTRLRGLDLVQYVDKTDANRQKTQHGEIVIVSETDRVYLNSTDPIEVEDPAFGRRTRIAKENSRTTVIWNPWVQKAHALSDFGDDEWRHMICVETSNVFDLSVELAPGRQHRMTAQVSVTDL